MVFHKAAVDDLLASGQAGNGFEKFDNQKIRECHWSCKSRYSKNVANA